MARGKSQPAVILDGGTGTTTPADNKPATEPDALSRLPDGTIIIDPGDFAGSGDGGTAGNSSEPRKRGRPRGSSNSRPRAEKGTPIDINGLELILLNTHAMLAGITKTAELELDETEAHSLAEATAKVARHYNMTMTSKALDWTNLLMVIGATYGTRLMAIRIRRSMERKPTATVTPIRPVSAAPQQPPNSPSVNTVRIPGIGDVEVPAS